METCKCILFFRYFKFRLVHNNRCSFFCKIFMKTEIEILIVLTFPSNTFTVYSCARRVWRENLLFLAQSFLSMGAISIYRVRNFFSNQKLFTVYMSVTILMPENSDGTKQSFVTMEKNNYAKPIVNLAQPIWLMVKIELQCSLHLRLYIQIKKILTWKLKSPPRVAWMVTSQHE